MGRRASALASIGVTRTFQNTRVFETLTVTQNLMVPLLHAGGIRAKARRGAPRSCLPWSSWRPIRAGRRASCPGGQQRLLEFARALITRPRMVLMDEPSAWVHPEIKKLLIRRIRTVEREGTSFLVVSHEVPDLVAMSGFMLCLVEGK